VNDPTAEFASLAERYCAWASGPPGAPGLDERVARELLPSLFLAAHGLPPGTPGEVDPPSITTAEWQVVYWRFGHLAVGHYGDTFDPLVLPPEEATVSDLADDLAGIHRDLLGALKLYQSGAHSSAAWHWRHDFIIHWGSHLVGALRALHHYWAKNALPY
jgi:hypothetical protein